MTHTLYQITVDDTGALHGETVTDGTDPTRVDLQGVVSVVADGNGRIVAGQIERAHVTAEVRGDQTEFAIADRQLAEPLDADQLRRILGPGFTISIPVPQVSADHVRREASRRMQALLGARDAEHLAVVISNAEREATALQAIRLGLPRPEVANPDQAVADHWVQIPRPWTALEATRALTLSAGHAAIEAIRAASNAMEAAPPADYTDDQRWPS